MEMINRFRNSYIYFLAFILINILLIFHWKYRGERPALIRTNSEYVLEHVFQRLYYNRYEIEAILYNFLKHFKDSNCENVLVRRKEKIEFTSVFLRYENCRISNSFCTYALVK